VRRVMRIAGLVLALALATGATPAGAQTPAAQDEFVPMSELPAAEQLPAAPLLLTAYAVFWVAAFVYLWLIRRRMAAVDRELADLRRRLGDTGTPGTRRP